MLEFYAVLTPCDDPERVALSWEQAAAHIPDDPAGSAAERETAARENRDRELVALRARLDDIESSRTWRTLESVRRLLPWPYRSAVPVAQG